MTRITRVCQALALAVALAACASPAEHYAEANQPLAEQGKLKWSEYYLGLYNSAAQSRTPTRARLMERANTMIEVAQSYENGKITSEQFQHLRRQVQAAQTADDDMEAQRRKAAALAVLQEMNKTTAQNASESAYTFVKPTPVTTTTTNCNSFSGQVNCTSTTQ